ncbi:MAG TPA: hypothetical protein VNL91_05885 [Thermoanaerobaculia bacterium]|nr:hypothetical protein [Thermoanaerobaculia bacterium]
MRGLAVVRHRLLTNIRAAGWVFGMSIALVALAMGVTGIEPIGPFAILMPESDFLGHNPGLILALAARVVAPAYILHMIVLVGACHAFGSRKSRQSSTAMADLMDAAPITPSIRFWGDALGVFVAAMTVHLTTLPLLAFVFAVSPLPLSTFAWLEFAVLVFVALESAAASWKLHASRIHPGTARAASSGAVFLILVAVATFSLTRWREFRDAWAQLMIWPSPRAWAAIVETIDSPSLLLSATVALYAAFIAFYYVRGIRALEEA